MVVKIIISLNHKKSCLDEIMIIIMHTVTEVSAMIPEQWFSVRQTIASNGNTLRGHQTEFRLLHVKRLISDYAR